ncbi:putative solute carrier organic anion transporter family member 1A4 [Apostichopus japonicus]|uniref:Putative solute carrier organic anion transporter family member 1A4 n=1 Tax=Stichopus japonicus TaxID=307972 RepID=A0A2G8LEV3_STIJA|nr:putative solute carrier organic anion transporter family member 1A4 [Apostichopus japonicus]
MGRKDYQKAPDEESIPPKRRWFFNHIVFTIICCSANILFTAHLAYLGGAISMIEKRFQMKSTQSGLFFTINDVVGLCTVLFITHFGQRSNRPRVIAALFTLFGIGATLSALPNFLYDLPLSLQADQISPFNETTDADRGHSQSIMCNAEVNEENAVCDAERNSQSGALIHQAWWIFLGQALSGLVSSTGPLIITFLDDNQNRKNTPLYIGIIFASWTIGIVLGFFLANFCLRLPVTFPNIDPETTILDPRDPRYLGAWWLGLIICGVGIIIVCFPLFLFPRELRRGGGVGRGGGRRRRRRRRGEQKSDDDDKESRLSTTETKINGIGAMKVATNSYSYLVKWGST